MSTSQDVRQDSLREGSLVKHVGSLWLVYRRINEDLFVIYPACSTIQLKTVARTDLLLPTQAELLRARLLFGISARELAGDVPQ
jgi:hypothetical protein